MDPASIVSTLSLLLSVTNKLMDKLPDYSQRKRRTYHNLLTRYHKAKSEQHPYRDDNLVGHLRDELIDFIMVFDKDIKK